MSLTQQHPSLISTSLHVLGFLYPTLCYVVNGSGWALLMKIDGRQPTFNYNSSWWTNTTPINSANIYGGHNMPDEFKSELFVVYPFSLLLLGMRVPAAANTINWVTLFNSVPGSLYPILTKANMLNNIVAPSPTRAQVSAWNGPTISLQPNCNTAGFNLLGDPNAVRVRVGFISNGPESGCYSSVSFVGFGGAYARNNVSYAAGSYCAADVPGTMCDNGYGAGATFGYIIAN